MTWFSSANRHLYDSIGGSVNKPLGVELALAKFGERDTTWLEIHEQTGAATNMLKMTRNLRVPHSPDALKAAIDHLRRSAEYIRENNGPDTGRLSSASRSFDRRRTESATRLLPHLPLLMKIVDALEIVLEKAQKGKSPSTKEPEVYNVTRPGDKRLILCP